MLLSTESHMEYKSAAPGAEIGEGLTVHGWGFPLGLTGCSWLLSSKLLSQEI